MKMPFHRYFALILTTGALIITGCGKRDDQSQTTYPVRPSDRPYYLNTSGRENIDDVAIGELQRARDLTGIDFTMYYTKKLPESINPSEYAANLFSQWKIGQNTQGRGVLFLFVEETGTLKIEVGYGVEGIYPDGFVGSFQDNLKNYFVGEYFGDFVSGMITEMVNQAQNKDSVAEMKKAIPDQTSEKEMSYKADSFLSGGAGTIKGGFFPDGANKLKLIRPIDAQTKAKFDKHQDPKEVIRRYVESLSLGINNPDLGLLTEGSRYMRMEYPKSEGFQKQAGRDFSGPYDFTQKGDYAAARFKDASLMPILLRKNLQGFWQVDVTKSWAYVQASYEMKNTYPTFRDHRWMFAWPEVKPHRESLHTPDPFPAETNLADYIVKMEKAIQSQPDNADLYFELAEVFYFECYWIRSAMNLLEEGLKRKPYEITYRERLIMMSYRFPDLSRIAYHYEQLVTMFPSDTATVNQYIWYLKTYRPTDTKKISLLESWAKNPPFPAIAQTLDVESAYFAYRYFPIPQGTKRMEVSCKQEKGRWDDEEFPPCVRITLSDSTKIKELGIQLKMPTKNAELEASTYIWPAVKEEPSTPIGISVASGKTFNLVIETDGHNATMLTSDGNKIALPPLTFTPVYVKIFSRSGIGVFTLK